MAFFHLATHKPWKGIQDWQCFLHYTAHCYVNHSYLQKAQRKNVLCKCLKHSFSLKQNWHASVPGMTFIRCIHLLLPGNFFLTGVVNCFTPPLYPHSWQNQIVWETQDSCHKHEDARCIAWTCSAHSAGSVIWSETQPRTRHSVNGCDCQQTCHGDIEVPV